MKAEISFECGRTVDTEPCIVLHVGKKSYIIGFPEQVLRLNNQNRMKILNMKELFLPSIYPNLSSGLIGLIVETFDLEKFTPNLIVPEEFKQLLLLRVQGDFQFESNIKKSFSDDLIDCQIIRLTKSICFDIKIKDSKGGLNVSLLESLGIKPGPIYGELRRGKSITLENGKIISSEEVTNPNIIGERFLFLECINLEDLTLLPKDLSIYDVIIHLTSTNLLLNDLYQNIFKNHKMNLCFIETSEITFYHATNLYSLISSQIPDLINPLPIFYDYPIPNNFYNIENNSKYISQPFENKGLQIKNREKNFINNNLINQLPECDSFIIHVLGSGCKYPSHIRNVSGYLIQTTEGFIVLDCGQGFYGQLKVKFGRELTNLILSKIFCIWISHRHSDHNLGLAQLLYERALITNERLELCVPQMFIDDIKLKENYFGIDFYKLNYHNRETPINIKNIILTSVEVYHIDTAKACLLLIDNKYKLVYSGDRSPKFMDIAESIGDCDILIHEATFPDSLSISAEQRRHTSVSQAIEVGKKMNSKYIILSHFSQRFTDEEFFSLESNVLFSFDFLSLNYSKLPFDFNKIKEISEKYFKKKNL